MLRERLLATMVIVSLSLMTGCDRSPTHDSIMEDTVTVMEDFGKTLATVKDEASANSAKPKLTELSGKMKALKTEADKMAKPTSEKEAELKKKYEDRMTKAMGTIMGEMMRIGMDPKIGPVLKDIDLMSK
jgi:hypothetical protein